MECADFLEFQDSIKKMRDLDDKIVYALNVNIPTPSFRGETDPGENCKQLYTELQTNYDKRESSIKRCINATSERINELKRKKENVDDLTIHKLLSKEQTKVYGPISEMIKCLTGKPICLNNKQKGFSSSFNRVVQHLENGTSAKNLTTRSKPEETPNKWIKNTGLGNLKRLRMLKNELLVEEVVKDRSLKIYHERCREYFKPTNYSI